MDLAYSYDLVNNTSSRAATPTPQPPSNTSDNASTTTDTATDPPTPRQTQAQPRQNLQTEFQETFKAFSSSPWGAKLGGLWGNVVKQGESYYEEAVREAEAARIDAVKGFNDIREGLAGRVRSLSINEKDALDRSQGEEQPTTTGTEKREFIPGEEPIPSSTTTNASSTTDAQHDEETNTFLDKFKTSAAARLKDVQAAEDAADQALLRFGTTIRSFLRDAVAITSPEDSEQPGEVLFESKDSAGKRTIHTSRMDAQLHLIHTSPTRLTTDPEHSEEWDKWKQDFDVQSYTERIAKDLETYPELRRVHGELVPEKVVYGEFWGRYYFLRGVVEEGERRRRELLKASENEAEQVAWDEDSDDDDTTNTDPALKQSTSTSTSTPQRAPRLIAQNTNDSTTTLNQLPPQPMPAEPQPNTEAGLRPEPRRSHDEKSVADSEASYDMVSGAVSRAASSPKERKAEESEDEDWE